MFAQFHYFSELFDSLGNFYFSGCFYKIVSGYQENHVGFRVVTAA